MSQPSTAHFGFTKLLVRDLESSARFYSEVCGLTELARVDAAIAGRPISEIMFSPTGEGAAMFVLLKFEGEDGPASNDVILGFQTDDVAAFVARAVQAGGKVVEAVRDDPEHGVLVGFVSDPEGHLIEVVQVTQHIEAYAG